jgi:hypothetical protein
MSRARGEKKKKKKKRKKKEKKGKKVTYCWLQTLCRGR